MGERGRLGAAMVLAALAGCGTSHQPAPPAPPAVPVLVPGPPAAYTSIDVTAGGRSVPVPAAIRADLAPLLVARVFPPGEPAAGYGLDHPLAHLTYRSADGTTIDVALGSPTFDRHFVYARRAGQANVALLASSVADPLLATVGVQIPGPT